MIRILLVKELKELFSAKIVIMMVIIAGIFILVGATVRNVKDQKEEKPRIGVIAPQSSGSAVFFTKALGQRFSVVYDGNDYSAGLEKIRQTDGICLIVLPASLDNDIRDNRPVPVEYHWFLKGSGIMDIMETGKFEAINKIANLILSSRIISEKTDLPPGVVLNPVERSDKIHYNNQVFNTGNLSAPLFQYPNLISNILSIFVMMLIIISASTIISSLGLERENNTLESLLSMPVKRETIIYSKILASAVIGVMISLLYAVGYYFFIKGFSPGNSLFDELGLTLNALDFILIGLSVFFSLIAGISISLYLGLKAKEYQNSQPYSFPVIGLSMLSMLLTTFIDFYRLPVFLRVVVFAIPFSHPMLAEKFLRLGKFGLVLGGIAYSVLFSVVLLRLSLKLFRSERVINPGGD